MTPYDRIRRNKALQAFAIERENPKAETAPFPRNATGLTVLMVAIAPLLYKATLDPSLSNILGYGLSTAGFGAGFWALAAGLKAEALYDAAPVARAPKHPMKMIGSALVGLSAAGLTWYQGGSLSQSAAVLVVAGLLCAVAYGRDPGRHKGLSTPRERQANKLDDLTARVGSQMERIREAAAIHGDPEVMPRTRALDDAVDALLMAAIQDPERLGSLRKYFGVYLDGAAEAAERFAAVYSDSGDLTTKAKYLGLLDKLVNAYEDKAQDYAARGQIKFDVQHDVLSASLMAEAAAKRPG